jgi:hypothetical protein
MRRILVAAAVALLATPVQAQNPDEKAAMATIERMFEGMRTADTVMVRAAFADGARFAMVGTRAEPGKIAFQTVDGWIRSIGGSNKRWDERVFDAQIRVDGNIAQAWTPYAFYLDNALRHCGVNSIELLKDASGAWKITQLSDTQRREGCKEVPKLP